MCILFWNATSIHFLQHSDMINSTHMNDKHFGQPSRKCFVFWYLSRFMHSFSVHAQIQKIFSRSVQLQTRVGSSLESWVGKGWGMHGFRTPGPPSGSTHGVLYPADEVGGNFTLLVVLVSTRDFKMYTYSCIWNLKLLPISKYRLWIDKK